jgi:hypothetical protein
VLGNVSRPQGSVVPDDLPGTLGGQGKGTVGINGTGTLDGSVPSGNVSSQVGVDGGLSGGVQR